MRKRHASLILVVLSFISTARADQVDDYIGQAARLINSFAAEAVDPEE
jgi:hypothetical protein